MTRTLPILAVLALGACSADPTAINATKVALTAAETAATIYVKLPICPVGAPLCSEPVVSAQIKAADVVAYNLVKSASAGSISPQAASEAIAKLVALIPVQK